MSTLTKHTYFTVGSGTGWVRPSGTTFVPIETIDTGGSIVSGKWSYGAAITTAAGAGKELQYILTQVGSSGNLKALTLPSATFEFSDFPFPSAAPLNGLLIGTGGASFCTGIAGSGIGNTTLRLVPHSCTISSTSTNPASGVNNVYLAKINHVSSPIFQGLTLDGTDQGTNIYFNGLYMQNQVSSWSGMHDFRIRGARGKLNTPPGETFALNLDKSVAPVLYNVELDGRDPDSGVRVSASLFGLNNCSGAAVFNDCIGHDTGFSHVIAQFTSSGSLTTNRFIGYNAAPGGTGGTAGVILNCEESGNTTHNDARVESASLAICRYHSDSTTGNTTGHVLNNLTMTDAGTLTIKIDGTQTSHPSITGTTPTPTYT